MPSRECRMSKVSTLSTFISFHPSNVNALRQIYFHRNFARFVLRQRSVFALQMIHQGCESCRKWQDHYYLEHMVASKVRFFKLMTGDFAQGIVSIHCPPKLIAVHVVQSHVHYLTVLVKIWRFFFWFCCWIGVAKGHTCGLCYTLKDESMDTSFLYEQLSIVYISH